MPMMTIIFGTTLQTLGGDPFLNVNGFLHQVNQGDPLLCNKNQQMLLNLSNCELIAAVALYFTYLAIGSLVASYGEVAFWMWTGECH